MGANFAYRPFLFLRFEGLRVLLPLEIPFDPKYVSLLQGFVLNFGLDNEKT